MKTLFALLTTFLLFSIPLVAYAQEPTITSTVEATAEPVSAPPLFSSELPEKLPESAEKGLEGIALFLAGLAGLLSTALIDAIKRLPFLKDEDKTKLTGPMANLLSAIVSIISGYAMGYLGVAAGFLDNSGIWQVILFSWPAAKAWFELEMSRKKPVAVS